MEPLRDLQPDPIDPSPSPAACADPVSLASPLAADDRPASSDPASRIISDFLHTADSLGELAINHKLKFARLVELLTSERCQRPFQHVHDLTAQRTELVVNHLRLAALQRLADIMLSADNPETARRAAAGILRATNHRARNTQPPSPPTPSTPSTSPPAAPPTAAPSAHNTTPAPLAQANTPSSQQETTHFAAAETATGASDTTTTSPRAAGTVTMPTQTHSTRSKMRMRAGRRMER